MSWIFCSCNTLSDIVDIIHCAAMLKIGVFIHVHVIWVIFIWLISGDVMECHRYSPWKIYWNQCQAINMTNKHVWGCGYTPTKKNTYNNNICLLLTQKDRWWTTVHQLLTITQGIDSATDTCSYYPLVTLKLLGQNTKIKSFQSFVIQQVCQESCRVTCGVPLLLPWAIRCCLDWIHFLVGFASVDLQTIFRIEVAVTLVTLECFLVSGFSLLFRGSICCRRFSLRWRTAFLVQKLCPPPGISS